MSLENFNSNKPLSSNDNHVIVLKNHKNKRKKINEDDLLISIIIPLYNEERSIKDVINNIPNHQKYEIILVDDGSTDNSVKVVKEMNRAIKLIEHEENQGYGAAILTGFKHANGNIIVTMDSDGQHNPEDISDLIKPILENTADLVVGSRYLGTCLYKVPLHTRLGEYFIDIMLWILYHQHVGNNQSGFKAFNRTSLKIFKNMSHTKFGICTEMLFKAAYKNLRIVEIPITLNPRYFGISRVKLMQLMESIFSCILVYGLEKLRVKRLIPESIYRNVRYLFR